MRLKIFILAVALLAMLPACGRKGALIIPGTVLPQPVANLKAEPHGDKIILSWTMPSKNTKGDPLTDLAGFDVLRAMDEESGDGCKCKLEKVAFIDLEYPKEAEISGKRIVWADKGGVLFGRKYLYKVIGVNKDDFRGQESNQAEARLLLPPGKPEGLTAKAGNRSVLLGWTAVKKLEDGSPLEDLAGYNVYRFAKKGEKPVSVNTAPVTGERFEDTGLVNNTSYYYSVSALRGKETPFAEGLPSETVEATPSDKEPPVPPTGLQAVPGDKAVLLSWDIIPDSDIKGYILYKRADGEKEFRPLSKEPSLNITFTDTEVLPGKTYYYAVTAVDNADPPNESAKSVEVSVTLP